MLLHACCCCRLFYLGAQRTLRLCTQAISVCYGFYITPFAWYGFKLVLKP